MTTEEQKEKEKLLLSLFREKAYVPMKERELAILLNIPRERRQELSEALASLEAQGKIFRSRAGKLALAQASFAEGLYSGSLRGYGFVTVEGREHDIYIAEMDSMGALDGDRVRVRIFRESQDGKKAEGKVVKILEHSVTTVIGTFQEKKHFGFVIPDNGKLGRDLFIPEGKAGQAKNGQKVAARITDYGDERKKPEGVITQVLGRAGDPDTEVEAIVRAFGLPEEASPEVLRELSGIPDRVTEGDLSGRMDLRGLLTVTIDGEDAKDLDDAVSLEKTETGYRLGVHIADVTHYVKEHSPLDREALLRGTSVYLCGRVIPMLPQKLSNGICSLNAGEDRLALSCLMELDEKGGLKGHHIAETVIRVDARLNYTEVNEVLQGEEEAGRRLAPLVPMLRSMGELSALLRKRREKRGAVDFDLPESKVVLDERHRTVEVKPYETNRATSLIEDFMLLTNETIAENYFWQDAPFLYRVHEKPDIEKIRWLSVFVQNFGYGIRISRTDFKPLEFQKLLKKAEGTEEEALISRLTLRSMKQAKYSPEALGHFGLAAPYYCHFTSPIRRYPDLQIHRIMKENLKGELFGERQEHYRELLSGVAVQSSVTERRAKEAEREVLRLKKAEYMSRHVGEEYEGVISGITQYGFYVELPNTVEGMVKLSDLEDYFHFDKEHYELCGELTKKVYRLGQRIRVFVAHVDRGLRQIDFLPVPELE